ncbi:MAG: hypothetical protein MOB07_11395 [Acidobacteria bacterium]|nr:hypothetical protein [Acidobacteriota bacterium]
MVGKISTSAIQVSAPPLLVLSGVAIVTAFRLYASLFMATDAAYDGLLASRPAMKGILGIHRLFAFKGFSRASALHFTHGLFSLVAGRALRDRLFHLLGQLLGIGVMTEGAGVSLDFGVLRVIERRFAFITGIYREFAIQIIEDHLARQALLSGAFLASGRLSGDCCGSMIEVDVDNETDECQ